MWKGFRETIRMGGHKIRKMVTKKPGQSILPMGMEERIAPVFCVPRNRAIGEAVYLIQPSQQLLLWRRRRCRIAVGRCHPRIQIQTFAKPKSQNRFSRV